MIKISTRLVILTKTSAYKIPLSYRGYVQGLNEGKCWSKYKHTGMLARLRWSYLGFVCQDRIPQTGILNEKAVLSIKDTIPEFNFTNCDLYNVDNWGVLNGKDLLLDYGIDKRVSEMY